MSSSSNAPNDPPQRPSLSSELDMALGDSDVGTEPMTAFLVGLMGNMAGKLYRIPKGESTIGRSSKCFLSLQEKGVSYQHAQLNLNSQGCTIQDLESTNGTRVNDVRIEAPTLLHAGDVIRIGQATVGFLTDAEDEQQHTRALARVTQAHRGLTAEAPNYTRSTAPPPAVTSNADIVRVPVEADPGALIPAQPIAYSEAPPPTQKLDDLLDKAALIGRFLAKNIWLIAFTTLGVAILTAATVAISPPIATAEFEVFLRDDPKNRGMANYAPNQVGFFEFAEKDFTSPELVKKTLEDLERPTNDRAINGAARSLGLTQVNRFSYFKGTYSHPDPGFAKRFLTAHLKNFLEYEISEALATKLDNLELIRRQFDDNHKKLIGFEEELRDFKKENLDALPGQAGQQISAKAGLLAQRDQLTAQLTRLQGELSLASQRLNSESLMAQSQVSRSSPYEQALSEVRTKIAAARSKGYAEGHPELRQLLEEEREYTRLKENAVNTSVTDVEREANEEYRRLKARVGELRVAVNSTQQELGLVHSRLAEIAEIATEMPGVEVKVSEQMRQVDASKKLHDDLFNELKARELELELERNNVRARYEVLRSPHSTIASPVQTAMVRAAAGGAGGFVLALVIAVCKWLYGYAKNRHRVVTAPGTQITRREDDKLSHRSGG